MRSITVRPFIKSLGLGFMFAVIGATRALAVEQTVQNDSFVSGGSAIIEAGFVANESAAAWLTSPCNGNIVAVQVGWLSQSGGSPQSVEDSITVFSAGTFPNPGPVMINSANNLPAILEGPVMTDGAINEFRFVDDQNSIPLIIPVTAGQKFIVSFKFANSPNPSNGPSVFVDAGCQSQKNAIFAIPPGVWFNSCSLGVSGDFVIRAVVDCAAVTGACCLPNGNCVGGQTTTQCTQQGGTYQGNNTTCGGVNCPQPTGACCINGACSTQTAANCTAQGGTFLGAGVTCNSNSCKGACCVISSQSCVNFTQPNCAAANGEFQGIGTSCANTVCFGACCLPNGTCLGGQTAAMCASQGGVFSAGLACGSVKCAQPAGRCCLNGNCLTRVSQEDCAAIGGTWGGPNSTCDPPNVCSPNCTGDIAPSGGDGVVNTADLLVVINNWGPCSGCAADINADGSVNTADLLLIINNWGACP